MCGRKLFLRSCLLFGACFFAGCAVQVAVPKAGTQSIITQRSKTGFTIPADAAEAVVPAAVVPAVSVVPQASSGGAVASPAVK